MKAHPLATLERILKVSVLLMDFDRGQENRSDLLRYNFISVIRLEMTRFLHNAVCIFLALFRKWRSQAAINLQRYMNKHLQPVCHFD